MVDSIIPAAVEAAGSAPNLVIRGFLFELRTLNGCLTLRAPHLAGYGAICADWDSADQRRRILGGRKQLLAKAVGLHKAPNLQVLDGTAGLGRDGYTLAALGATVTLMERTPALVLLLRDAHRRALENPQLREVAQRIHVLEGDTRLLSALAAVEPRWDVVVLDPMYPDDGKSALPSKEMQVLRDLTGGDADADELLDAALTAACKRVVVKRPAKAPWMAGRKPNLELKGTQARFDIYLL